MTLRHKRDLEILFDALGGESGLELTKDVILGSGDSLEMIDEKKSLALIGKVCVKDADDARQKFKEQHGLIGANGKFQNSVKVAFFNMGAVESAVGGIATDLKGKDQAKAQAEEDRLAAEEAAQDAIDIGGKKLSYKISGPKWEAPETPAEDCRKGNSRLVAGGDPEKLGSGDIKQTRRTWRPITRYMVGEPDKQSGDFKVYVEDEEVVNCEAAKIHVEFLSSSYSLRVETGDEPLVLGPVECGQVDIRASKWRLSQGKRLTMTIMKARNSANVAATAERHQRLIKEASGDKSASATKDEEKQGMFGQLVMSLVSLLPVLFAIWYMKGSGGG